MSSDFEYLVNAIRVLRSAEDPQEALRALLKALVEQTGAESGATFVRSGAGRLLLAASANLEDDTAAALSEAARHPGHPIARTLAESLAAFNVRPTAPGGPALRSHLPLIGRPSIGAGALGVVALAHDRPLDDAARSVALASGDLMAVALELWRDAERGQGAAAEQIGPTGV